LENVYIEEEYRKQGLGTQLLKSAIEEAKRLNCYKIIGTSRVYKEGVHKFYLKNGFTNWGYEFRMDLKKSEIKQRD
jgi:GNAT superfamily N-acetyltransferase